MADKVTGQLPNDGMTECFVCARDDYTFAMSTFRKHLGQKTNDGLICGECRDGQWPDAVVYRIYKDDDLKTLPAPILAQMVRHLQAKLSEAVGCLEEVSRVLGDTIEKGMR